MLAQEEEFRNRDLEELMMEEAGIKEKMYFLKMVGIILMINVITRLMVQKANPSSPMKGNFDSSIPPSSLQL